MFDAPLPPSAISLISRIGFAGNRVHSYLSADCHNNILNYLSVNAGVMGDVSGAVIVMEAMAFDLQHLLVHKRRLTAITRTQRMR